jgi:predicted transposase YbfD/YdcC
MPRNKSDNGPKAFIDFFANLPDPRLDRQKRHALIDIFVVTLCAVLTGAEGWTEVEQFGKVKLPWLRRFVKLENGIPSHDTFARVFRLIDPKEFGERFLAWVASICGSSGLVAIDGKTVCGSYDKRDGKAAIHMVSAWAVENRLVLGQIKTNAKSNEITAIPELLRLLDVKGCIVSIDAMGCQKKIAQQITESGGDYVLGLKGNQSKLKTEVETFFECAERDNFAHLEHDCHTTVEKDHGRIETRKYRIVAEDSFEVKDEWGGLNAVGMVKSERIVDGVASHEKRYYICSRMMSAEAFGTSVRGHWGIENSLHWVLDVVFREDDCRVRKDHAPENLSTVRKVALNLLRKEKTICKLGLKAKRHRCAIDDSYLENIMEF